MSSTTNLEEEEIMDTAGNDGNASIPEQFKRPNPWRKMMMMMMMIQRITQWHLKDLPTGDCSTFMLRWRKRYMWLDILTPQLRLHAFWGVILCHCMSDLTPQFPKDCVTITCKGKQCSENLWILWNAEKNSLNNKASTFHNTWIQRNGQSLFRHRTQTNSRCCNPWLSSLSG